jgi:L-threonylcarbamoyladenylate synthase
MKIIQINLLGDNSKAIAEAVSVLKAGGVIVYPTDTVYGLGANACDWMASEQVFKIKQRSFDRPLPIIARNMAWVKEIVYLPTKLEIALSKIWPGPTTVVLPKKKIIPDIVTAKKRTVGIRIPASGIADRIMAKFGYPLTATSANISGQEPTTKIQEVIDYFKDQVWKPDLILAAGNLPKSEPSTVLDLSSNKPKITRVGPSKPDYLMQLLKIK